MVIQARRRFVVAFVLALFLALTLTARAQVMIPSGCKGLTPSDLLWWTRQCYLYMFAADHERPFTGFVVR